MIQVELAYTVPAELLLHSSEVEIGCRTKEPILLTAKGLGFRRRQLDCVIVAPRAEVIAQPEAASAVTGDVIKDSRQGLSCLLLAKDE